ncbi:uncharacterized protein LAESUDRAFT_741744 [Laetiporus sulphureus 93-53]|uniref:Protein kinase domain-containing protein n=1 Tax=Laetiporus sulphureus 93-53 TaxID=1314785 RepID=A0A165FUW2_9APHY|nr:uncharacterized protein LAESUDRAFT_741744 [Laetiporus sulphureus 93-53]KZT09443.1 hypothetical protein LAESUDRAFT_741744 [Laetiporus sulphureus 93-53]
MSQALYARSWILDTMPKVSSGESDSESIASATSSVDEEDVNTRLAPNWCHYRHIIGRRGFRLDTCSDVKQFYQRYWEGLVAQGCDVPRDWPGYLRACNGGGDDELCKDVGLPDNLFRGTRCSDDLKVVIKAVHTHSREYDIVRYLSTPPVRDHPMNHCIPVLNIIDVPEDRIAFIVMEEWSPHLVTDPPYILRSFLGTLRQHLEHITFMHAHHIAHLDISLRNMLTDNHTRYACIDFETSRRFDKASSPRVFRHHAAETPPEVETSDWCDPYKIDVYASGILMLRAANLTGHNIPELSHILRPMLAVDPESRPTIAEALITFNGLMRTIEDSQLDGCTPS